ncbi:MAG: carboxypeptidase-like regulatory domain-containing protein [Flavobacteriales bacterium]|nr:carboxypeptidase-like regulatory domain-containing protein [Flavobacteriales bacterium]
MKDKKSGETLPFVSVVVENKGTRVAGGQTDFDGNYTIKPIDPGTYDVIVSYVGYQPMKQTGVVVNSNKITFLDIELSSGVELQEFEVVKYQVPLIDKDGGASGGTVTREQIAKMPQRSAAGLAVTVAGASDAGTGGGISIRGARSENTYYYIDGVKVPAGAGTGLPKSAIEEVQVITGGVPANYGDVTGGLINITTRGPSRQFFGGVEYLTSGWQLGDDVTDIVGLDKYAFNQVEASLSGPIFFKKDSVGNKVKPLLGFFVSGQFTDVKDGSPLYYGDPRVKGDVRDALLADPLTSRNVGGTEAVVYKSDYLRASDLEELKTRQNAASRTYLASGKFDIATTPTINLTVGGSFENNQRQDYNRNNALLNAENNANVKDQTWRSFIKFTQRFNAREEEESGEAAKKGGIRNAFYTLQFDYSQQKQQIQDEVHKDNYFDYGYLGRFERLRAPSYELTDAGTANARYTMSGFRDTLVTYAPGSLNPDAAAVTNSYYNLFDPEVFPIELLYGAGQPFDPTYVGYYENFNEIQARNGRLNGQQPLAVYNMWNNIGTVNNQYLNSQSDQVRVSAIGSADIGKHAVSVGVEYEQLTRRTYNLAPVGLWTRARQLANFHLQELDKSDSTITYPLGTTPYITYQSLVGDDQAYFDRKLRESLGLDPRGTDFLQVDALDPSSLSLDMFSADELVNSGNGTLVNYWGYDHRGNKVTGQRSIDKFFDERDADGNFTRVQAPFAPIYMAGYVMDKFAFDDIIFNVGVRVDRYDANQSVLKDKYLWRPAYTAGSQVPVASVQNDLNNRPSNIGEDYVVYVDNINNPTAVVGYRDGDTWYNADGVQLNDPSPLRTAEGIAPYLIRGSDGSIEGDLPGSKLTKAAFEDYKPVVNVMPRIAFSFPISDEAVFFAHYDILTQRPTSASRLDMFGYSYIEATGDILNNPALKPTKTIDYELGFQQVLTKASSLKISAFYRELRDMIQVRNVLDAWPVTYRTYANLDFGTVKGLTLAYDLRRTGNVWLRASYTLQFADGTGSGPNTGINLINSGQPNLRNISPLDFDQRHRIQTTFDFRYGSGTDYNGPMLFGKPILQRTGLNVVGILGSGTPYSASSRIINEGQGIGTHALTGSLNGARLPWQFTTDLQLDRDIPLTFNKGEGEDKAKSANLNVYLLVTNVFNTENITGVWRATGSPTDDGYLAAPQYQNEINTQVNPASYTDLYALKVNNPYNFGAPRTIRLGFRFDF